MKTVLGLLVLLTQLHVSPVCAASFSELTAAGKIKIATEGQFSPFNYFKGKDLVGFEVDIANEVMKRLKLKPEWQALSFDSLLIGLNQNRYDLVIASHAITEERAKAVEFGNPHYCSGAVIVSRPGGPLKKTDLKNKIVSAQVGTIYVGMLQKVDGIKEVKTFTKDADSIQALLAKKTDAMVVDKFVAIEFVKANAAAKLQIGDSVSDEKVAMAVAKGNTSLRDAWNSKLAEILKNGTYAKLSKQYFGQDVRCK